MWWFIKEFTAGLALRWKHWTHSKPIWRCEPGEVSPRARALMLGAVKGISGPLVAVRAAKARGRRHGKG